jgi:hypothetical protein
VDAGAFIHVQYHEFDGLLSRLRSAVGNCVPPRLFTISPLPAISDFLKTPVAFRPRIVGILDPIFQVSDIAFAQACPANSGSLTLGHGSGHRLLLIMR